MVFVPLELSVGIWKTFIKVISLGLMSDFTILHTHTHTDTHLHSPSRHTGLYALSSVGILRQRYSGTSSRQPCSSPLTPHPGAWHMDLCTPHGHSEAEVHTHTPAWVSLSLSSASNVCDHLYFTLHHQ